MVRGVIRVAGPDPASVVSLERRFAAVRERLGVPDGFPPEVLAAADEAARTPPPSGADLTGVPFVTVDPPGSTDLDQALHLERRGDGYHLDYAIADVPAFVLPGGPVDAEARRRGQTLYAPDKRAPLHPPVLSEAAASLLPDQERPAFLWRFDLDAEGEVRSASVVRARCRARAGSTTATCRPRRTPCPRARPIPRTSSPRRPCSCARSASGARRSKRRAAPRTCHCRSRRWRPATGTTS